MKNRLSPIGSRSFADRDFGPSTLQQRDTSAPHARCQVSCRSLRSEAEGPLRTATAEAASSRLHGVVQERFSGEGHHRLGSLATGSSDKSPPSIMTTNSAAVPDPSTGKKSDSVLSPQAAAWQDFRSRRTGASNFP